MVDPAVTISLCFIHEASLSSCNLTTCGYYKVNRAIVWWLPGVGIPWRLEWVWYRNYRRQSGFPLQEIIWCASLWEHMIYGVHLNLYVCVIADIVIAISSNNMATLWEHNSFQHPFHLFAEELRIDSAGKIGIQVEGAFYWKTSIIIQQQSGSLYPAIFIAFLQKQGLR